MSMKNFIDTVGNQTRDLLTCSAVPQPTALPRVPSERDDVLLIIRLKPFPLRVFDKWLPTFGKVNRPQLFIPVERMYSWWHYLCCSNSLDIVAKIKKYSKVSQNIPSNKK
jgi:hypothetical protein